MKERLVAWMAVPVVALAWYAGYRTGVRSAPSGGVLLPVNSRPGTPVASFDGQSISAEELKAQIEEQMPHVRQRYTTVDGRREFLEGIVRFELLAREAQKKGYLSNPEVARQCKRNLVGAYVQKEFEEYQQKQSIADEELRKYYDDHKDDYVRPERVRVAQLLLAAPPADAALRKAKKAAAETALAELKAKDPRDYNAFAELARTQSEDASSRAMGGDLHFLSREDLARRAGPAFAEAAFAAKEIGRLHEGVVETDNGFHLFKLLGREPALDQPFEQVKDTIKNRILFERRSQNYQKFVEKLEQQAGLKIETGVLNDVKVETGPVLAPKPGAIPQAPGEKTGVVAEPKK